MRRIFWVFLTWLCVATGAQAQTLETLSFEGNTVIARISSPAAASVFAMGEGKPRVVIDLINTDMNLNGRTLSEGPQTIEGQGNVKRIRLAKRTEGLRAVLDLEPGSSMTSYSIVENVITVNLKGNAADTPKIVPVPVTARYFKNAIPYPRLQPLLGVKPRRKPVIVIDPGHGGRDPGAVGLGGTKEKTITTAATKELQKQLLATGHYEVIVTRSRDVYIDHEERIRIARAGGADLFISIHADSTASKTARGASVYTLADRAKNRSKRIVNNQNWIMDVDLTKQSDPVGDILVDLAQRNTESKSEEFADILLANLKNSTELIGNSHRRAGYFVLLAPDVPAVLLELGFLSNPQDEKLLNSAKHRKKVLRSVTRAINTYFEADTL